MKTYKLEPGETLHLNLELYMTNDFYHIEFNDFEIEFIIKNYLKLKGELSRVNYFAKVSID